MTQTTLGMRIEAKKMISRSVVDSQDIGLVVRYKGSLASATVTVDATTGDITFKQGTLGAEAVDSTIDSGAGVGSSDPGIIDVSDSNVDTMGEVVDMINASANWEAYLVDVLRTDDSRTLLLTMSATQAHKGIVPQGVRLFKSSPQNDTFDISIAIMNRLYPNGFERTENKINVVKGIISNNTFASGTNKIQVYEINPITKVETKVFERAGAATTVTQALASTDITVSSDQGNYLLVRMISSAAAATGLLTVVGEQY